MLNYTPLKGNNSGAVTQYCENGATDRSGKKREDYFSEQGQVTGMMMGSGWGEVGLGGAEYKAEYLERALDGQNIITGDVIIKGNKDPKTGKPKRLMGWDATFSAPKSVSVLRAQCSDEERAIIDAAQDYAVGVAVKRLENDVKTVNVGQGGKERETAKLFCVAYNHLTGRPTKDAEGNMLPGDPDIHTHLIIPNYVKRADGKIMSLNSTDAFLRKKELGAIYRAALADYLKKELGVHFDKYGEYDSLIRVSGVSKDVERAMSKRRQEIEGHEDEILAAMSKYGITKGAATDYVAKKTRNAKTDKDVVEMTTDEIESHWRKELDGLGFTREALDELIESSRNEKREYVFDNKTVLRNVTDFNSVFSEFNLKEAIAFAGAGVLSIDEIDAKYDELINSDEIIRVSRKIVDVATGKTSTFFAYTTQEMIDIDRGMVVLARELKASNGHVIGFEIVERLRTDFEAKTGFKLSRDQLMGLTAATQGSDLVIIEGVGGSGKTSAIVIAKEAFELCGYNVLGCAPSGKAAAGLKAAGIDSVTIARLLMDAQGWTDAKGVFHPAKRPLTAKDIIVVDEVGLVGSRDFHALERAAREAGAKLIFMGDRKQLQAVSAGGALNAVVRELGGVDATLDTVHRQKAGSDIAKIVAYSRDSQIYKSLDILDEIGCLALVEDKDAGIAATISAWKKHYDHNSERAVETSIMLANSNVDVDRLNSVARIHLKEIGVLNEASAIKLDVTDKWGCHAGQKEFCENERIVFLKNEKIGKDDKVMNGMTGRILSIEGKTLTVQMEGSNKVIQLNTEEYSRISHAYALTTHKSQGITVDHAAILAGGGMQTLNQTYVQLSRVRHGVDFVIPKVNIELQMANAQPTEKMLDFARRTAERLGHDRDMIDQFNFLECRDYLNDHTKWMSKGKPEDELSRWRREIGELIVQMSTLDVKETTLDYTIEEKAPGVANVYPTGELSSTAAPRPMRYAGSPRTLDTVFYKEGDAYKWKDSGTVAIISRPEQVNVKSKADEAIVASLQVAKEKFGNTITTNGSESFRQKTWLEGTALGMEIQGYTPTKIDKMMLEHKLEAIAEAKAAGQSEKVVYDLADDDYEYVPEVEDEEEEYIPEPEPAPVPTKENEYAYVM